MVMSIGEARRRIAELDRTRDECLASMADLVRQYEAEFTDPPIVLRTHRSVDRITLLWRRRGRGSMAAGQSVFRLASA
ncbi:hypothetical protein V6O07_07285, partial [Arthrospira platensis SPKY2]